MGKALSIRQPWAWLIVNGFKDIENRTWNTKHRGEFLIHAAEAVDWDAYHKLMHKGHQLPRIRELERGGIVGRATLVDVLEESNGSEWWIGPRGFVLKDAQVLPFHKVRGRLLFFNVEYPFDKQNEVIKTAMGSL